MLINISNLKTVEKIYNSYKENPDSVELSWRSFFDGFEFAGDLGSDDSLKQVNVFKLINAFRYEGFKHVNNNPLEKNNSYLNIGDFNLTDSDLNTAFYFDEKKVLLKKIIEDLKDIYCNRIGFEFGHCDQSLRSWIQKVLESSLTLKLTSKARHAILEALNNAEIFEQFLNTKYPGQKRFSLEGAETLIPIIHSIIGDGVKNHNLKEVIIGMAHRGRLNVLANILKKPYSVIFHEFEEDYYPFSYEGSGDVKYHKGFSTTLNKEGDKTVHIHLSANPSHLESIDSIVLGQTYAKQFLRSDLGRNEVLPILIHGDASFAGQGVVYESLQFMQLENYSVGGTIHIIINNQIGFTTLPEEGKSTQRCSDIAKAFGIPVFHINAEDPESCIVAATLAMEIKNKFKIDVILDLICYRKYGHNEGDEPAFTQPLQYDTIRKKHSIREIYRDSLISQNIIGKKEAKQLETTFKETLDSALKKKLEFKENPPSSAMMLGSVWSRYLHLNQDDNLLSFVNTGIDKELIEIAISNFSKLPEDFNLHPKLKKWLLTRSECISKDLNDQCIDWAFAEMLALSSILLQKIPVRFAGQDSKRGTFNQRHLMWVDQKTANKYYPLSSLSNDQASFEIVNTPLSEFAALGFEYGYSLSNPVALVLWEAQFGDFSNEAQVLIDQYIVSAEKKWQRYSSLAMLLPHGFEGQGPEHSSARVERFLQLCADDNIQVVNCTTPAQYFHLLRRQALRKLKKPLIIFTPKSLLREKLCKSSFSELTTGNFQEILENPSEIKNPRKLIFCSGKIFYDLIREVKESSVVIIRIEQLYPLHKDKIKKIMEQYQNIKECFWVQEEPENMGAWSYIYQPLQSLVQPIKLKYIGREASASPAVGSHKQHLDELTTLINKALE